MAGSSVWRGHLSDGKFIMQSTFLKRCLNADVDARDKRDKRGHDEVVRPQYPDDQI